MAFFGIYDLEDGDFERVRQIAEDVAGPGNCSVQQSHGGTIRIVDLRDPEGSSKRDERAEEMRAALKRAGFFADITLPGKSIWRDVEVSQLESWEGKRRKAQR